jgi:DNA-binding transcriptional LysR family regulator
MELLLLRTLVAVAEVGSFSAAATRLCITQSAVSRRIKQLEEHCGVTLLDRAGPAVRPTEAGHSLVRKARQMLEFEREMEESISTLAPRHRISFCCTPSFGTGRLPDIFERFVSAHGLNIDLNIVFQMPEDVLEGLSAGRFDLAVVEHCEDLDLGAFPSYSLPEDEMVFVSAPTLEISESVINVERIAAERLYLKTHNGCAYRFLRRSLRLIGHEIETFRNLAYFDDLAVVVRQVVGGHGLGFVSRDLVTRELENGLLRVHRVEGFDHRRPRTLLISPRIRPSAITMRFIQTFFETLGMEPPVTLLPTRPDSATMVVE